MLGDLTRRVCWGFALLELESVEQVAPLATPSIEVSVTSDALSPLLAFLTGLKPLTPRQSLFAIGIGTVHNVLVRKPVSSIGTLQSIGMSGLLLYSITCSEAAPLLGVLGSYIVLKLISANRARRAVGKVEGQSAIHHDLLDVCGRSNQNSRCDAATASLERTSLRQASMTESMGLAMMTASMWFGRCVASGFLTSNEIFITGLSLISFGHLASYAIAKKTRSGSVRWRPGNALVASGIGLLQFTATGLVCDALLHYNIGAAALRIVGSVGSHALELYFIGTVLEISGLPQAVKHTRPGITGRIFAAVVTNALLVGASLLLDSAPPFQTIRFS